MGTLVATVSDGGWSDSNFTGYCGLTNFAATFDGHLVTGVKGA